MASNGGVLMEEEEDEDESKPAAVNGEVGSPLISQQKWQSSVNRSQSIKRKVLWRPLLMLSRSSVTHPHLVLIWLLCLL